MNKATLILTIAIIGTYITAQAQSDFRPGYIITNNMDTLQGFIDYRGEVYNSKICVYKTNDQSTPIAYKPGQIYAYRLFDDKYYISKIIGNDTVYLEYLVSGIINLYFLASLNDKSSYFLEKNNQLIELTNEEKQVIINGHEYKKNTNQYIGYLKATFADCMKIQPELDKAHFDHKSLTKLTVNYHHLVCTDSSACVVYEKKLPVVKVSIAPAIGFNVIELDKINLHYNNLIFNTEIKPTIGVIIKTTIPRINDKFSLYFESFYTWLNFSAYDNGESSYQYHYTIDLNSINALTCINYEYPKGKVRPIIGAGYILQFIDNTNLHISYKDKSNGIGSSGSYNDDILNNVYGGFNMYVGCNFYLLNKHILFANLSYSKSTLFKSYYFTTGMYF